VPSIKETFLKWFPVDGRVDTAAIDDDALDDTLERTESTMGMSDNEVHARRMAQALSVEGKGCVSIWQLNWHLEMYRNSAEEAVAKAGVLLKKRLKEQEAPEWMSTRDWLLRCGLEEHVWAFEKAKCVLARDFQHMGKDDLKKVGVSSEEDLALMEVLLKRDEKRSDILQGFQKPNMPRVEREFLLAYPEASQHSAHEFSIRVCTEGGHGLVSLIQLTAHFKRHKGAPAEAIGAITAELVEAGARLVAPDPPPEEPEPTDWIAGWLKAGGLGRYVGKFIEEEIKTPEDVVCFPITEKQLEDKLGMKKMGHRRKLMEMMQGLDPAALPSSTAPQSTLPVLMAVTSNEGNATAPSQEVSSLAPSPPLGAQEEGPAPGGIENGGKKQGKSKKQGKKQNKQNIN